ncbi:MAG: rhodanese-like domain-containing protein [Candidatus Poribacteria bacterium]|nr:rhodanese-like domain-containing protein [Candidatus Poribacteria bacterium]
MFQYIRKAIKKIRRRYVRNWQRRNLPKAAPSVAEAILPLDSDTYTIAPRHLKEMIDQDKPFVLLDVREKWEYEMVHIERAILIPFGELPRRFREVTPGIEIVVYCHWGMRSLDAAFLLQQLGFKSVKSLVGGIDQWAQEIDTDILRY